MDFMDNYLQFELALIINHEAVGPSFCAATIPELNDVAQRQMFASRVILTAGIGDYLLTSERLHGPIEVIEIESKKFNMVFYPFHHMIPGDEGKGYGEIRRVSILTIFYEEKRNQEILPLIPFMEKQLRAIIKEIGLELIIKEIEFIDGQNCQKMQETLMVIKEQLEYRVSLRLEGIKRGTSLFDLGVASKLPKKYRRLGLVLIQDPDGWLMQDLAEKLPDLVDLEQLIADLSFMGYVTRKGEKIVPV